MKVQLYHRIMAMQASRRSVLKGGTAAAAVLGASSVLGGLSEGRARR